jgi:hypothetical protein
MTTTIKDATSIISSKFLTVNVRDGIRSVLLAAMYAGFLVVQTGLFSDAGFSGINWEQVLLESVRAAFAYIGLNFLTQSKVMIKNPPPRILEAVKDAKKTNAPVQVTVSTPATNN